MSVFRVAIFRHSHVPFPSIIFCSCSSPSPPRQSGGLCRQKRWIRPVLSVFLPTESMDGRPVDVPERERRPPSPLPSAEPSLCTKRPLSASSLFFILYDRRLLLLLLYLRRRRRRRRGATARIYRQRRRVPAVLLLCVPYRLAIQVPGQVRVVTRKRELDTQHLFRIVPHSIPSLLG